MYHAYSISSLEVNSHAMSQVLLSRITTTWFWFLIFSLAVQVLQSKWKWMFTVYFEIDQCWWHTSLHTIISLTHSPQTQIELLQSRAAPELRPSGRCGAVFCVLLNLKIGGIAVSLRFFLLHGYGPMAGGACSVWRVGVCNKLNLQLWSGETFVSFCKFHNIEATAKKLSNSTRMVSAAHVSSYSFLRQPSLSRSNSFRSAILQSCPTAILL